jgi:site-specific DNA-methyltransferase (adenine-specific)
MILRYPSAIDGGSLLPGQIVFMICSDGEEHKGEMLLRKAGLEVRDSIRWFHGSPVRHITVVVGRKPIEGTVAENTLRYGCGGINVDGCRVPTNEKDREEMLKLSLAFVGKKWGRIEMANYGYAASMPEKTVSIPHGGGRWPANIIHDGNCIEHFPETIAGKGTGLTATQARSWKNASKAGINRVGHNDSGSAARFFYLAETESELIEYLNRLVKS